MDGGGLPVASQGVPGVFAFVETFNFHRFLPMLFPAISITSSTPFDFRLSDYVRSPQDIANVEVYADPSGSDIYYGPADDPAIEISNVDEKSAIVGSPIIPKQYGTPTGSFGWHDIKPGHVFSCDDNFSDNGKYVVAVDERFITMNADMTISYIGGATFVFAPPTVNSTNGIPLLAGTWRSFTADKASRFLNRRIRFVVASGTGVLRLWYKQP